MKTDPNRLNQLVLSLLLLALNLVESGKIEILVEKAAVKALISFKLLITTPKKVQSSLISIIENTLQHIVCPSTSYAA